MQFFDLEGKTILITGASSGLGEHLARVFSQAGARIILTARRFNKLEKVAHEIEKAFPIQMDISDQESVKKAFDQLERNREKIDICVNNAGTAKWTPLFLDTLDNYDSFAKGGLETWEDVLNVNLTGTWSVIQAVAIHMKNHHIPGSIINIASTMGDQIPVPGASASSVSKAGIIHLTRQLVPELSKQGIRINCIIPGMFWSDLTNDQLTKRGEEIKARIPLGFIGEVSDFEGAILYFASNTASRYVTGACLTIDGGASWSR